MYPAGNMSNFWKTLKKPITVLAPMHDVTDYVFREILSEICKPDVMYTEFTNTDALFSNGQGKALLNLKYSQRQRPIVAQVWGADPDSMRKAGSLINGLGFDGLDINMGCPDKSVYSANAGSALIGNFVLAEKLIKAARKGCGGLSISIKTRLAQTHDQTCEWISFLLKQDIQALVVHARTRKQMYGGLADWGTLKVLAKLKNETTPEIVFIGNGDVKSYDEVLVKQRTCDVDGVMIGRAILSNPYVFSKDSNSTAINLKKGLALLKRHTELYQSTWGSEKNFNNIKKFIKMYINGFDGAGKIRAELMNTTNYENFYTTVRTLETLSDVEN